MREIQIDTDVFAAIWKHRIPGEESENQILRRILLGEDDSSSKGSAIDDGERHLRKECKSSNDFAERGKIRWVDDVVAALKELGGEASLHEIYKRVREIRKKGKRSIPLEFEATIRRTLEDHSSDSANFRGIDLFKKVSRGVWALR